MPSTINETITVDITKIDAPDVLWRLNFSLTPFFSPEQAKPKNIIFLLDSSNSMREYSSYDNTTSRYRIEKIDDVRTVANLLLDKLNPCDTFSIVKFGTIATPLLKYKKVSEETLVFAKQQMMNELTGGDGNTDFKKAFEAVNTSEIIPPEDDSSIIFLTDAGDGRRAEDMVALFGNRPRPPRIIPIGILERHDDFLDQLALLGGVGKTAFYINKSNDYDYLDIFHAALQKTQEPSYDAAQLEITIEAKNQVHLTTLHTKKSLVTLSREGRATRQVCSVYVDSLIPPHFLRFRLDYDGRSLHGEHRLTDEQYDTIQDKKQLLLTIPSFRYQDNTQYSWMMALGAAAIGLLIVGGVAIVGLSAPYFDLVVWQTMLARSLTALVGLSLLVTGATAIARKTLCLPTRDAATDAQTSPNPTGKPTRR